MTKLAKPQLVGVTWKDMYDKYDRMRKVSEKAEEFFDLIAESKKILKSVQDKSPEVERQLDVLADLEGHIKERMTILDRDGFDDLDLIEGSLWSLKQGCLYNTWGLDIGLNLDANSDDGDPWKQITVHSQEEEKAVKELLKKMRQEA